MSRLDLDLLRRWIGACRVDEDVIAARHARLMAATMDPFAPAPTTLGDGASLPPLWHWIYFLEGAPARELGRDGHPARGGFLPPVPLANRMWAGGRVRFAAPVRIGTTVRRKSTVLGVDHKAGHSGDLVFVTVLHELQSAGGEPLVREEHDIVYRDPSPAVPAMAEAPSAAVTARTAPSPEGAAKSVPSLAAPPITRSFVPTSTTLFRYSALTFNGHRIHYDVDYCRAVEGYPNLVVHGPLIATLLASFAEAHGGVRLAAFSYRALAPAFLGDTLTLHASPSPHERRIELHASLDDGRACMRAEASLA